VEPPQQFLKSLLAMVVQLADLVLYLMKVPFTVVCKNPYLLLNMQIKRGPIGHFITPIPRGA
jgi:hypothetical protein